MLTNFVFLSMTTVEFSIKKKVIALIFNGLPSYGNEEFNWIDSIDGILSIGLNTQFHYKINFSTKYKEDNKTIKLK